MPIYAWILIAVACVPVCMAVFIFTASVTPPADAQQPIAIDGKARRLDGERYLEYRVGIEIAASPDKVWALLTNAAEFPSWNSTIISIGGNIAEGEKIKLKSKVAPDREFPLLVSEKSANKMVWQDGNRVFRGVRTFTVNPQGDGNTAVTMAEVLTGAFLPQIAPKLPDFLPSFDAFAADLKRAAEA